MKSVRDLLSESKVKLERKERRREARPEVMKVSFHSKSARRAQIVGKDLITAVS